MVTYPSENFHQVRHNASIDDLLNLIVSASRDVGECPGRLLLNVALLVTQQGREHGKSTRLQHSLRLFICASDNVTDRTQ